MLQSRIFTATAPSRALLHYKFSKGVPILHRDKNVHQSRSSSSRGGRGGIVAPFTIPHDDGALSKYHSVHFSRGMQEIYIEDLFQFPALYATLTSACETRAEFFSMMGILCYRRWRLSDEYWRRRDETYLIFRLCEKERFYYGCAKCRQYIREFMS